VYHKIDNSLIQNYLEGDSYMAKVSGGGMTNARALQVLAKIERRLVGYNGPTEKPLAVKKQVQDLIGEATDIENLSQGTFPSPFHCFELNYSPYLRSQSRKADYQAMCSAGCLSGDSLDTCSSSKVVGYRSGGIGKPEWTGRISNSAVSCVRACYEARKYM
jgi:hypothetical protein